jgi:DNA repair protein RecN (Recombination protein N)
MQKDTIILKKLSLQNFATFEQQDIEFLHGLNIIVGETGSGKSLILDALQLIFGGRADKGLIRANCKFAAVEASFQFDSQRIADYLEELGHPTSDNEIIIKRLVYNTGKHKAYINFQQTNLNTLTRFTRRYVDLVGQFENQKLLSSNYQLKLLDLFAKNEETLKDYSGKFKEFTEAENQIQVISECIQEREQKIDYLDFQISEIEKISLEKDEEKKLIEQKKQYQTQEEQLSSYQSVINLIQESEKSALSKLKSALKILESQSSKISSDEDIQIFNSAILNIEEFCFSLSQNFNDISIDPEEHENIVNRLDIIQKIKRKFGATIDEVLTKLANFREERGQLLNIENKLGELKEKTTILQKEIMTIGEGLSLTRAKSAKNLSTQITKIVQELNMNGAQISFQVESTSKMGPNGFDELKVMAETNPGEGLFELKKIASGGELSRVLLALRQALTSRESVSIFLFDEVDAGIGGETALKIGQSLSKVAFKSQVIAITHLPQIAINADKLIKVNKKTISKNDEPRTISLVEHLSEKNMIKIEAQKMILVE